MNVLVTGASGFVGGNLVQKLLKQGHQVTVLARKTSRLNGLEKLAAVRVRLGDLRTGEGLMDATQGVDCVFHVAGVVKARTPGEFHQGNVEGTRHVCEAIVANGSRARLVVCSSLAAAGPSKLGAPKSETAIPAPISIYGRSKLAAENVAREYQSQISTIIVRPPIVYGPGDRDNIPSFLPMAKLGVFLKAGLGPKEYSFIHVDDLCDALIAAAQSRKKLGADVHTEGVYFVSDGENYSWDEFCQTLASCVGRPFVVTLPVPNVATYAVGWASEVFSRFRGNTPIMNLDKAREMREEAWTCSIDKAKSELSFHPQFGLSAGMKSTVSWFQEQGLL